MSSVKKFDVIVIGAGSAGLNVAMFFNRIGLKVLLVEKHLIGGDCLNYGCVPSKSLISLAHDIFSLRKGTTFGFSVKGAVDMKQIALKIAERQDVIREHENPAYFRKLGITVEMGAGCFVSPTEIAVNGKHFTARKIVIATGSRPLVPKIEGLEKVSYFTNETIFANSTLPNRLLVIGSGPIGIELAQAYGRLGSSVTVVSRGDHILLKEDDEIARKMQTVLEKEGMKVVVEANPVRFEGASTLVYRKYDRDVKKMVGPELKIGFDQVLIATGRALNIDSLGLEKAGIAVKDRKIVLDRGLRTTNKRVYVCGDAGGTFLFTHWAETEAKYVITNMMSPFKRSPKLSSVAWVTYTDPEIATFGKQEGALVKGSYSVISQSLSDVDRAIAEDKREGLLKIYHCKGKILGGVLMAPHAGEMIGELITAMEQGISVKKLFNRIYPYPTLSRITRRAVGSYLGERLTTRSKKLLRRLFYFFNR
ncbi:MAG: FAD-dependent oxidoreductase [Nanoarchaeota archaeon]|nr:FAD-dependent oxidoreductase [Nanoarchaeota archaeon]